MSRAISLSVRASDGTPVYSPLFDNASRFRKTSQYPAGLYGVATFTLPGDAAAQPSALRAGHEVRVSLWGREIGTLGNVYHGYVISLEPVKRGGVQETLITCIGAWGWFMERDGLERNWADTRLTTQAWARDDGAAAAEKATDDRDARIRITPKGVAWTTGQQYVIAYQTPTGELVGKVTCNYDMQEGAQAWELALFNGAADEFSITASGTGSQDVDLGTFSCTLYFEAKANQTPTEDGTYYGEIDSLTVFASRDHASATLGTVNVYEIALDIVDRLAVDVTRISANLAGLDSTLTLSLVPFITKGYESYASILARAASYGTSAKASIGYGLRSPFLAPDDKPRLFLETYPVPTDWDYEITTDECELSLRLNLDDVFNYITVEYKDAEGIVKTITPEDDADLTDATSVAQYGTLVKKLVLPLATAVKAKNFGARFLERHKQPTYAVTQPVEVAQLRAKNGGQVPAALIDAGKRLHFTDLPNLIGQENPTGTTFLITATDYDHDRGIVRLSLGGRPDDLTVWLAQMSLEAA